MSKIIAFVGMPGSGASTANQYISSKGYPRVHFGGVIYDAMTEKGVEITAENQTRFRSEIRRSEGDDFVAKKIIEQINDLKSAGQHHIVADGLYSWTEYKMMKRAFPGELIVIAVLASRSTRHRRLSKRPLKPFTSEEAKKRDWDEIENIQKGGPIAVADFYIINESNIDDFTKNVEEVIQQAKFYER